MWSITVSESNPDDKGCALPNQGSVTYALGTMDFLVRPPPVPKGAAAFASRAERAEIFTRRLLDTATDQEGEAEIAMPVTASVEGRKT